MGNLLTPLDLIIFVGSLFAVMAIGLWAGRKEDSSADFYLAGKTTRWWGVAGSIFGSNVSANHIIGMMGVGFSVGFAQSHFEISAIFGLLLMCYGFLPVYRRLNVYTLSEYLSRRYDDRSRVAYAIIMLVVIVIIQMVPGFYIGSRALNILLREGENATAAAIVNQDGELHAVEVLKPGSGYAATPRVTIDAPPQGPSATGATAKAAVAEGSVSTVLVTRGGSGYDPTHPPAVRIVGGAEFDAGLNPADVNPKWYVVGILLMAVVTGTYTIIGGLKAVIVTDVVQSLLMLLAAVIVAALTFMQPEIGGWDGMRAIDVGEGGGHLMRLYRSSDHPQLPWSGVLTGLMVLHFYYWGTNQFIVQRALAARDDRQARLGIIIAGFFKLLIPFMSIGAGIAAFYLFEKRGLHVDQDAAFPELMKHVVAPLGFGVVGLVAAGVVGAILSSIDSMMNSAATIVTFDFYRRYIHPEASERNLILMGRVCIALFLVAAAALTIFTSDPNSKDSFFLNIASHQSKLVAGVVVAFALGMFWKRATAAGALAAIVVGVVLSYALPVFYAQGIGYRAVDELSGTHVVLDEDLHYRDGRQVMFHALGSLPVAMPQMDPSKAYFVKSLGPRTLTLHDTSSDVAADKDPLRFAGGGVEGVGLYDADCKRFVALLGVQLNFMHSVFAAALAALAVHVLVSLATTTSAEQSSLTWTELGGHDPSALRHVVLAMLVTLIVCAVLATLMVRSTISPTLAAVIAGLWVWLLFLRAAWTKIKELRGETGRGLVAAWFSEDRFWAGLLCGTAVFMMFYFY